MLQGECIGLALPCRDPPSLPFDVQAVDVRDRVAFQDVKVDGGGRKTGEMKFVSAGTGITVEDEVKLTFSPKRYPEGWL